MKRKKRTKIILKHDKNEIPDEAEKRLEEWCLGALQGKNKPLLMDYRHSNFENLERAASQTSPKKMKDRLMKYLKEAKGEYISGFEYGLIMVMCGYDYNKAAFVQEVN